jgi:hypothetical protein
MLLEIWRSRNAILTPTVVVAGDLENLGDLGSLREVVGGFPK